MVPSMTLNGSEVSKFPNPLLEWFTMNHTADGAEYGTGATLTRAEAYKAARKMDIPPRTFFKYLFDSSLPTIRDAFKIEDYTGWVTARSWLSYPCGAYTHYRKQQKSAARKAARAEYMREYMRTPFMKAKRKALYQAEKKRKQVEGELLSKYPEEVLKYRAELRAAGAAPEYILSETNKMMRTAQVDGVDHVEELKARFGT